ncbi:hypothetical protein [Streptomyces sp. NPDC051636]|uniref:hypothetical protein n=1 Tax=Streptomyces sp. NPDC051636 TaxID=3365663 RepID=UPI00378E6A33
MTGPEHYREGEHLLGRCLEFGHSEQRQALAVEAAAHFLAALVALHAAEKQPESIRWQEATK